MGKSKVGNRTIAQRAARIRKLMMEAGTDDRVQELIEGMFRDLRHPKTTARDKQSIRRELLDRWIGKAVSLSADTDAKQAGFEPYPEDFWEWMQEKAREWKEERQSNTG